MVSKKIIAGKKTPDRIEVGASTRVVKTKVIQTTDIPATVTITGRLVPSRKIDLFSEVTGILLRASKPFKEGTRYQAGEILLQVDAEEFANSLRAQRSTFMNTIVQFLPDMKIDYKESAVKWEAYLMQIDPEKTLPALPEANDQQIKYFLTARNIYNQYYTIKAQEVRLTKYKITAPYSGVITQSLVDFGATVRAGQQLGQFSDPSGLELEATVSATEINFVRTGAKVTLTSGELAGEWQGTIKRISEKVDPTTQSIKVFISVLGKDLKEGLYLAGKIQAGTINGGVTLPRKLLVSEDQIYLIKDSTLALQKVNIEMIDEGEMIVTGLKNGELLLNESLQGAFEGMVVKTVKEEAGK